MQHLAQFLLDNDPKNPENIQRLVEEVAANNIVEEEASTSEIEATSEDDDLKDSTK